MSAQIIRFPNPSQAPKRKGRKPKSKVHPRIAERFDQVRRSKEPECDELKKLRDMCIASAARGRKNREERYQRWLDGDCANVSQFYRQSNFGVATESFGSGPREFEWAVEDCCEDPISWSKPSDALALAVQQLNVIGTLIRYGGWKADCQFGEDGTLERDFPTHAICDFAEVMVRLRQFGTISTPTDEERLFISEARAQYLAE